LLGTIRPLSARSVLATALLGADQPRLRVSELIAASALFGISAGAARTCLSRMVSNGELLSDNASYALAGHLLERRHRIDNAARGELASALPWRGKWTLAVVSIERRSAAERLELRTAAMALHLAEIKEGVWIRPDNLDPDRLPRPRAVLDRQCVHFRSAESDISVDEVRSLFSLDAWMRDATTFRLAMNAELGSEPRQRSASKASLAYQFALSIAVIRHLQRDPNLPAELVPKDWPADDLRSIYRELNNVFKQRMNNVFRDTSEYQHAPTPRAHRRAHETRSSHD
jgi:phenylacetic acid degradation operon negative regulatory protein